MKGWHFDEQDNKAQRALLQRNESAQRTRIRFPRGTEVRGRYGIQSHGVVERHVPGTNAQGGYLVICWDGGHVGRVSPITVEAV